ncbi:Replication protein A 70 kDa DNA-binding subunit B [Bienertia sinuspersici]
MGKVYYISKGTLKVANKRFNPIPNDYEMTLNENSVVEEVSSEGVYIPETVTLKKTVVVSLWNDHATTLGQELLDMADNSPVVAIKSVKVGDFPSVSLSAVGRPNLASVGAGMSPSPVSGGRSTYTDRVSTSHITSNPSLGEDKILQ